jgi:hypothetical protein
LPNNELHWALRTGMSTNDVIRTLVTTGANPHGDC